MKVMKFVLAFLLTFLAGCATIITGTSQDVSFNSVPPGATISVDGQEYGKTPRVLELDTESKHAVLFELEGYQPYSVTLEHSVSGWVWGNILFGGLIGLVIDAASGGMYKLTPEQVTAEMQQGTLDVTEEATGMVIGVVMQPDPSWQKVGQLTAAR